ncbi:MAG: chemotaxis protein CheW [Candidatus Loosdrechtia sp.]|uniref:chemotaxis protein CheW n=1 Tax=Candidatus Loosdrechtia sp. TaxID=3101272 RepID=UPI003A664306|nr:MAG: chemotaxis protein CheW [Candidatus Jettenia sp. AMX2]
MEAVAEKGKTSVHEGKYLTFVSGKEEYGIEILKVREIIGLLDITKVPQTPDYMKGVINLRGKVIPVIDLRLKFSMPEGEQTQETCIIVVEVGAQSNTPQLIGIIVDSVSEVSDIGSGAIEETPNLGQGINTSFIMGLGKIKGKIVMLLDIEQVLSSEELEIAEQLVK